MGGIREKDEISFNKLYANYHSLVYGICFSILKNKEDAEDVMQIVFSKIYETSKEKLPKKHEASWLYTVTRNETISYLRKKEEFLSIEDIYEIESTDNSINEIIDKDEYRKMISTLNDKEKEIVSLKVLADLSFKEIGKLIKEPTNTIKWRYYKAIHSLKFAIGNLALFVVSFVIGIKVMFTQKNKEENQQIKEDEEVKDKEENTVLEDIEDEDRVKEPVKDTQKTDSSNATSSDMKNENTKLENGTNTEIEQIENEVIGVNYFGISAFLVSCVFLVFTIVFLISFIKSKVNGKKKLSK